MQDREPDEFRESTSFFQIWLLFRQNRVALFCFYLFCLLILTALFPKLIMPYSESMEFVGEELEDVEPDEEPDDSNLENLSFDDDDSLGEE